MADSKHNGSDIIFKAGSPAVAVAGETGCSLSISGESIDTTSKDTAQWKSRIAGRSDWSVSGNAMLVFDADTDALAASQKAFWTAISTGALLDVEIALTDALTFTGKVIMTSIEVGAEDSAAATFAWQAEGASALVLNEGA